MMPAPKRGEIVPEIGNEFRAHKQDLGSLVSRQRHLPGGTRALTVSSGAGFG
jgi:hypothetical protein